MPPNTCEPRDYDKQSTHWRGESLPSGLVDQNEFENSLVYIATAKDNKSITHSGSNTEREQASVSP